VPQVFDFVDIDFIIGGYAFRHGKAPRRLSECFACTLRRAAAVRQASIGRAAAIGL
jgi:hypothetical protein